MIEYAIEANFYDFFAEFRHWPRARVQDRPDLLWTLTDIPFPLFNSVLRAHLESEQVDTAIREVQDGCRQAGVPMLWWTGPDTRPHDLKERLLARGFAPAGTAIGMAHPLTDLVEPDAPPEGLRIERLDPDDREGIRLWCALCARGFDMPAFVGDALFDYLVARGPHATFQNYLGTLHGEPVASGSLYLREGVAGIYNVATLPEARRKGVAAAVVRAALGDAKGSGQKLAILHATQMGAAIYRRLGFEDVCPLARFVWRPE